MSLVNGSGQSQSAGGAVAQIKMHVLVIAVNKEESEKLKSKVFDFKFSRVSNAYPGLAKIPKDVHAIVAHSKTEADISLIAAMMDDYSDYTVKVIYGKKNDTANLFIDRADKKWDFFEENRLEDMKSHIKTTFDIEVEKIKQIFESMDEDNNKFLSPFELTLVSQKLGQPLTKEQIEECVKIIDADGNGEITFDEFAVWWIAGRAGAPEGLGN